MKNYIAFLQIRRLRKMILFFIIPSIVEYISGYLLKKLFDKSYWSYLNLRYNLNGYICLKFSVYWMLLSFIGIYFLQNILDKFYYMVSGELLGIFIVIINFIMILDFMERIIKLNYKSMFKIE